MSGAALPYIAAAAGSMNNSANQGTQNMISAASGKPIQQTQQEQKGPTLTDLLIQSLTKKKEEYPEPKDQPPTPPWLQKGA